MASREEYNKCMRPFITGSKSKEQRKLDFCIGAKVCSNKAKSEAEAREICLLPKEPKAPRKTTRQRQKEQEACDPNVFFEVANQFKNLYINVHGERCTPCHELDRLIKEAEIPHQIVTVPETCVEIIDQLGIDAFPTVIKMSKGKIVSRHIGNPDQTIEKMKMGE